MSPQYVIGLDYGTNSVRTLIVNAANGKEVAAEVWNYEQGEAGVLLGRDPNLARQHPAEYVKGAEISIQKALAQAIKAVRGFKAEQVIGMGVDTTGSTPIPVDSTGQPLAFTKRFAKNPAAMAWLWKDHTGVAEAAEITQLARELRPQYLAKCGGTYSSEWFFSKILHCLRTSPEVFKAAHTWVECADWVPAMLTGTQAPDQLTVGVCAAGHKAMYSDTWGGYPDEEFLSRLDPQLGQLRTRLRPQAFAIDRAVGTLTEEWSQRTGLPAGIPVAVGAFDAHLGAVGAGIAPGTLVKIIGTSTCDMMVVPVGQPLADIPGLCGIVNGSILPGYYGLEAGQSAVGDIFNWFVNYLQAEGKKGGFSRRTHSGGGEDQTGRVRPDRPGLEQRQPYRPGRSAPDGAAPGPDPVHDPGGDLSGSDRGHCLWRPDDHQSLSGIWCGRGAGGQLRRHRREESAGDADLRRCHRPANEGLALGPNLCFGGRHRWGCGGQGLLGLRRRSESHDRFETEGVPAEPESPRDLS